MCSLAADSSEPDRPQVVKAGAVALPLRGFGLDGLMPPGSGLSSRPSRIVSGRSRCDSSYLYATATQQPYLRARFLSCWGSLQSYCLKPIMVRGGGMSGKDEKTLIDALGSPGSRKMPHATKRPRKNRGVPPPATFDIDTLPGSSNLTALEAAAVIRRTPGALELWRRDPNHPLKWRYVDGRPLYRVDAVRDYLARCDKTTKPSRPHNARGGDRATRP